jgi:O-antigen/teichoic acid export membrane protein
VGAIFLLMQGYGLVSLFLVIGGFHLAVSLLYIVLLYRFIPGFRLSYDRQLLRSLAIGAIPFVIIIFTGETVRQVDRIFISKLWDTDAVGYYATGTMLIQVMYLVAPAMMTALFPGLSRVYVSSLERFGALAGQLFKLLLVAIFPVTLGIIGLAGWIIPLVFGPEYEPSINVLRITALGIVPSFVARFLYRVMLASDNERLAIHTAAFKGFVSLALNAALIPTYGILGASVAAALTELLGLGQNLLYVSTKIVPFDYRNALLRPGVSILASSAVYLFLSGASHIAAWLAASVVFVAGILLTGTVRWGELRRLLGLRTA